MRRRKSVPPKPRPSSWVVETTGERNGRSFSRGDEITVRDHNGRKRRVRFIEAVTAPAGEWITVAEIEATGKCRAVRSFAPDRIVTVHRDRRLDKRRRKG